MPFLLTIYSSRFTPEFFASLENTSFVLFAVSGLPLEERRRLFQYNFNIYVEFVLKLTGNTP